MATCVISLSSTFAISRTLRTALTGNSGQCFCLVPSRSSAVAAAAKRTFDRPRQNRFAVGAGFMNEPKPSLDDLRIERKSTSEGHPNVWLGVLVVLVLVVASAWVWWFRRPHAIEVRTVLVKASSAAGNERTVLNASGYVTARRQAT